MESSSSSAASTISLEYSSSEDNDITEERPGARTPAPATSPVLDNTNTPPSTPPSHALPGITSAATVSTSSGTTTTSAAASAVGGATAGAAAVGGRATATDTASAGAAAAAGADPTGSAAYIFPTGGGDRSQVNDNIGVPRLLYHPLSRSHITLGGFRPTPASATSDLLKYVPNNFGDPQSWTFLWRNVHLEIERSRKKECSSNGKKQLFKNTPFLVREMRHSPNASINIDLDPEYFLLCSITSLYGHPTSINISTKGAGAVTLCIYPADLLGLTLASTFPTHSIDVPVRQGASIINVEKVFEPTGLNRQSHIGFRLKQFNLNLVTQIPRAPVCMFIPIAEHANFQSMLARADQTIALQHEILSQNFATSELVTRKTRYMPNPSRELLYYTWLNTFFGLDVRQENKLPAHFVLRDFIEEYLCDRYSLYFNDLCGCRHCSHVRSV